VFGAATPFPAAVDLSAIGRLVLAAFVAGIGVTASFSFLVLGVARASEFRAAGRPLSFVLYAVIAVVGLLGTVLAVYLAAEILTTNR